MQYRGSMKSLRGFLEEKIIRDKKKKFVRGPLHGRFQAWAEISARGRAETL